ERCCECDDTRTVPCGHPGEDQAVRRRLVEDAQKIDRGSSWRPITHERLVRTEPHQDEELCHLALALTLYRDIPGPWTCGPQQSLNRLIPDRLLQSGATVDERPAHADRRRGVRGRGASCAASRHIAGTRCGCSLGIWPPPLVEGGRFRFRRCAQARSRC